MNENRETPLPSATKRLESDSEQVPRDTTTGNNFPEPQHHASSQHTGPASGVTVRNASSPGVIEESRPIVVQCCCGGSVSAPKPEPSEQQPCCCCFEVNLSRLRVLANKDGKAELMVAAYANEFTTVHPSLGSWIVVSKHWGWVSIGKRIGLFSIPQGGSLPVSLRADAIEVDGAGGGSWELGSSEESREFTLKCNIDRSLRERVQVATHRDKLGGGETARIEIEFEAFKVPCPTFCGCT